MNTVCGLSWSDRGNTGTHTKMNTVCGLSWSAREHTQRRLVNYSDNLRCDEWDFELDDGMKRLYDICLQRMCVTMKSPGNDSFTLVPAASRGDGKAPHYGQSSSPSHTAPNTRISVIVRWLPPWRDHSDTAAPPVVSAASSLQSSHGAANHGWSRLSVSLYNTVHHYGNAACADIIINCVSMTDTHTHTQCRI